MSANLIYRPSGSFWQTAFTTARFPYARYGKYHQLQGWSLLLAAPTDADIRFVRIPALQDSTVDSGKSFPGSWTSMLFLGRGVW